MKQRAFAFAKPVPKRKPAERFPGNRTAAEIILADPAAHGGEESLAVRWARMWTERYGELREWEFSRTAPRQTSA